MKVRILKATRRSYWYANYVGYVFEVVQDSEYEDRYMVIKIPNLRGYLIHKVDCEVIG